MRIRTLGHSFLVFLPLGLFACVGIPDRPATPYLGEDPPGLEPRLFAPGTVSTDQHEVGVAFSPDGREVFFSRFRPGLGYVVMRMFEESGSWAGPEVASFSGSYSDVDVSFSPDGQRLFYISKRPLTRGAAPSEGYQIWSLERSEEGWGEPYPLGRHVNMGPRQLYPTATASGALYFNSSSRGYGQGDFFRAEVGSGGYGVARNLGPSVNSEYDETDAFVSPDDSYLIFTSVNRPDGFGNGDLYISFRDTDGYWVPAINMGPEVNGPFSEFCPTVSPDGKFLFFTSRRRGTDDIYWIDARILDRYRQTTR